MAQEHLSRSLPTCASVVLSCSCMEFNTFCTVGTTELLTSAFTALSSFPDKVVVSACDNVLCNCSCLFLSPECFSRRALSRRWAMRLVKESIFPKPFWKPVNLKLIKIDQRKQDW